jgi:hypothetical protein
MPVLVAALLAAAPAPPIGPGHTATIFATVQHSEFCPAGNVTLDLRTGRYALTRGAPTRICRNADLERPIVHGRLGTKALASIRLAWRRVWAEGVTDPACEDGGHPDEIVISNGGTPILALTAGAGTIAPPEDLTCWSKAASALYDKLEKALGT